MTARAALPPLWTCPKCGAKFVSANMSHSCGRYELDALFTNSEPHVFELFQTLRRTVQRCGPSTMVAQKSRVAFMVRMRFVNVTIRKAHLRVGLVLERRLVADARLVETQSFGPRCHAHYFKIERASQLDTSMAALLREAYDSGTQKNFQRVGKSARRKPQA
jgi:ribosomal protein S27AE